MAIQNIGSMMEILNKYNANDWSKSAKVMNDQDLSVNKNLELDIKQAEGSKSFSELLVDSIKDVNNMQVEANKAMEKLVTGESKNIHETMLTVEKAHIALQTMNQIRSKVIEAYREVMRMQI